MVARTKPVLEPPASRAKVPSVPPVVEQVLSEGTFSVEKFVESFPVLVEAPGGIEGLRALVLHLATRGSLVTHSSHSSPSTQASSGIEPPFSLPAHWEWRRVDEVGDVKLGRQRSPQNHIGPHMRPYLRVANVHEARIDTSDVLEMNFTPEEAERFLLKPNDVLLNEGQSYELVGRPAIYRGEVPGACFQNTLIRFRPGERLVPEYALVVFRAYMRTGRFRREAQQTTNIAHLSAGRLVAIEFPLPPLAEQKRIVERVDQLMALIDDLEAKQNRKREVGARFTKASLEALTTAEGPDEFEAAWKRVVENWETVIDRPEKVGEIRRTVLELAARGLLTTTEGGDVPVKVAALSESEPVPFSVRPTWRWGQLESLCEVITKGSSPKWQGVNYLESPKGGVLFVTSENVGSGRMLLEEPKFVEAKFNDIEPRSILRKGDLLMNIVGASIGRAAIYDRDDVANINQAVCLIRLGAAHAVDAQFLLRFFNSPTCIGYMFDKQVENARANLSMGNISRFRIPLPPLAEQKRIVAKVDHLMKLCDQLEAALRRSEDWASKLVEAVVQEMVA